MSQCLAGMSIDIRNKSTAYYEKEVTLMNLGLLKIISTGLTLVGGAVSIVAGIVDQKTMTAEVAKQVAEALSKNK